MSTDPEPISLSISAADLAELEEWASNSERTLDSLLQEAMQDYLERGRRWIAEVDVALDDVRAGRVVSQEQVLKDSEDRRRRFRVQAAE